MTPRIITADEAREMLDARESKGAWRVGTVEAEGKVWARDPEALGGDALGEVCVFNANIYRPHNGNRALAAAAPDLAATVVAHAAEIDRLRAIIDGRTTPPTDAEIAAHDGPWLVVKDHAAGYETRVVSGDDARSLAIGQRAALRFRAWVWHPFDDRDGRPCAWPVVAEVAR